MMNVSVIVLSCDIYSVYWDWFFACKNKYWKNCPYQTFLVTETKRCRYCQTINVNSPIWTKRFREALKQIETDYVIVMLEDYFIRKKVDQSRISTLIAYGNLIEDVAVFNFEKSYRENEKQILKDWAIQKQGQVYLNSTQPSWWLKDKLLEQLQMDQDPWEWELTVINNRYKYLINTADYIIDNGYRHDREFGVKQGKLTDECREFLKSEGLL